MGRDWISTKFNTSTKTFFKTKIKYLKGFNFNWTSCDLLVWCRLDLKIVEPKTALENKTHLPDHNVPRGLLQQRPVGGDGGEQRLAGALTHGGPRVDAELAQLGVEAQPQAVEGGGGVEGPVQGLPSLLGLLLQRLLLPLQLLRDGVAPLEEVVWNVPLRVKKEEKRGKRGGSGVREWRHK